MPTSLPIGAIFDAAARDYDRLRRQLIPDFDTFYGWVLEVLPFEREAPLSILDLGAGTGLLSGLLAEAYPNARFTLLDAAPQMLERAHERFQDETRLTTQVADYITDAWPHEFDAVVSALSLHHIGPPQYAPVFRKVHQSLKAGGFFVNADQVLGVTPEHEAKLEARWEMQVRALGCTEAEIEAAKQRMEADDPATLEFQLQALRDAGFQDVECWYKNGRFTVYSGVKTELCRD